LVGDVSEKEKMKKEGNLLLWFWKRLRSLDYRFAEGGLTLGVNGNREVTPKIGERKKGCRRRESGRVARKLWEKGSKFFEGPGFESRFKVWGVGLQVQEGR